MGMHWGLGVSILALFGAPDPETIVYVYDVHGRLVAAQHAGDVNDGVETDYTLDDADNRTNLTTTVPLPRGEPEDEPEEDAPVIEPWPTEEPF